MAINLAQKAQNFTHRGRQALETGRFDLAMEMLMEAVQAAPDVLETRKLLRIAQIGNFKRNGKSNFISAMYFFKNYIVFVYRYPIIYSSPVII